MSGGAHEYVAGYMSGQLGSSGFSATTLLLIMILNIMMYIHHHQQ